jgi:hypothetical protein
MRTRLVRREAAEARRREREEKRELRRLLRAERRAGRHPSISHPCDPHSGPLPSVPPGV